MLSHAQWRSLQAAVFFSVVTTAVSSGGPGHTQDSFKGNAETDSQTAFVTWLLGHGAKIAPGITLKEHDGIRGVFNGDEALLPRTEIVSVPRSLLIHEAVAVAEGGLSCLVSSMLRDYAQCDEKCLEAMGIRERRASALTLNEREVKQLVLSIFLMERLYSKVNPLEALVLHPAGKSCSVAPPPGQGHFDAYVRVLPSFGSLGLVPLTNGFGDECCGLLNGTITWQMAVNKRQLWQQQFNVLLERHILRGYSFKHFMHGRALVKSRSFELKLSSSGKEPVLVPFGDLFNMGQDAERPDVVWDYKVFNADSDSSQARFVMTTSHHMEIRPHNELFDSYGSKPNYMMYENYGFFFEHLPFEPVTIELWLPRDVEMRIHKRDALDVFLENKLTVQIKSDDTLRVSLPRLLTFARVAVLTQGDIEENVAVAATFRRLRGEDELAWVDEEDWKPAEQLLSRSHEMRALAFLAHHVQEERALHYPQYNHPEFSSVASRDSVRSQCMRYLHLTLVNYGMLFELVRKGLTSLSAGYEEHIADAMVQLDHCSGVDTCMEWSEHLWGLWHSQVPDSWLNGAVEL